MLLQLEYLLSSGRCPQDCGSIESLIIQGHELSSTLIQEAYDGPLKHPYPLFREEGGGGAEDFPMSSNDRGALFGIMSYCLSLCILTLSNPTFHAQDLWPAKAAY